MTVLRSIGAVALSYIIVYGLVMLTDPVLIHFFPQQYDANKIPSVFFLWVSTLVFAAASVLGGWICVRMAPFAPVVHLLVLFAIGELIGLAFTARMWPTWPHWYSIAWLLVWPIGLWLGGLGRSRAGAAAPAVV